MLFCYNLLQINKLRKRSERHRLAFKYLHQQSIQKIKQQFAIAYKLMTYDAVGRKDKTKHTHPKAAAWQTKVARDRIKYPEEYRLLCSTGARVHNIKNNFTKKRKATK